MKKYFYVIALFLSVMFVYEKAFATSFLIESIKIPTSLQQIVLCKNGIFLDVEGELYKVSGVVEEDGQFFVIPSPNAWICDACNHHNFYPMKKCIWCGNLRYPEE